MRISKTRQIFCNIRPYFLLLLWCCYFPLVHANEPITLSLDEAILLAVRSNPNVQTAQLNHVVQKFNFCVQQWQFYPHYSFLASAGFGRNGAPVQPIMNTSSVNIQPSVSLLTPIGTQMTLTSTNTGASHYNPGLSFQLEQPLLRGFGKAVVEAALNNANDSEIISRLNIEGVLRYTISAVINAYLDIVSAEQTVIIDEKALERARRSVDQTKLFIKAGHKAGNELVTVEADAASAQSQLENDKNHLAEAQYALLAAIGMDPNTEVRFTTLNLENLSHKYHLPELDKTKRLTLENDIQYQTDQITLHGPTTRNLMIAEDNTRWRLNFSASATSGGGSAGGKNAGINSLFNGVNQAQSVGLTLQVPIDDQVSKQAVLGAKVALKEAKLALMQEKWNKETSAINGWNLVRSAERALHFANDAEQLQEKTYNVSYQKYLHGLIDSLVLQTAQVQLIQSQQTRLSAEINYIKALVNLDLLIGNTLHTWDVQVRL